MSDLPVLYLLNYSLNVVDVIRAGQAGYSIGSVLWDSKFYDKETCSFKLAVDTNVSAGIVQSIMADSTAYLVRGDTRQICYITKKEFDGQYLMIDGEGILSLLDKRFTNAVDYLPTGIYENNNKVGQVMCDIINNSDPYPWIVADRTLNEIGEDIATFTKVNKKVSKYLKTLSKAYKIGLDFRYNPDTKKVIFSTYGILSLDTLVDGRGYNLAKEFDNVQKIEYTRDFSDYYNFCRVQGNTQTAFVDLRAEGEEKYSCSIKSSKSQGDLSEDEYLSLLEDEGKQELASKQIDDSFEADLKPDIKLGLGWEVIANSRDINISRLLFCTALKETWESGYNRSFTLGIKTTAKEELLNSLKGEIGE